MQGRDYEELGTYTLDDDLRERLLREQNELTFMWVTREGAPVGVHMSYVWRDGSFWVTSTTQRPRVRAIERDSRVCVAVSGVGTSLGAARTLTARGRAIIHDDAETKAWFYPAVAKRIVPGFAPVARGFALMLDSERRVVIEIKPEKWISYDASKLMADTAPVLAEKLMPESLSRAIRLVGGDPVQVAHRFVHLLGMDDPRSSRGPRERLAGLFKQRLAARGER